MIRESRNDGSILYGFADQSDVKDSSSTPGWKLVDSGFLWQNAFDKMVQKLVVTQVHSEDQYFDKEIEVELPWILSGLVFEVPEINRQFETDKVKKIIMISDVHLGSRDISSGIVRGRLINLINTSKPDCILLLGDIFDVWAIALEDDENCDRVVNRLNDYKAIVQEVCSKVESVLYIPGNHEGDIGQKGSRIRELIQFEWQIRNFAVCERLIFLGKTMSFPGVGGYAIMSHGHEFYDSEVTSGKLGNCIAKTYQKLLESDFKRFAIAGRQLLDKIPRFLDGTHVKLKRVGVKYPAITLVAGHSHRPLVVVQKCSASFENIRKDLENDKNWVRLYINCGSFGYGGSYVEVEDKKWALLKIPT